MQFKEIQDKYRDFIQFLLAAHSSLNEFINLTHKFIQDYRKLKDYENNFALRLDLNLFILERTFRNLDDLLENIESTSIGEMRFPKREIQKKSHLIQNNNSDDIYINMNHQLDWTQILKQKNSE